MTGAASAEAARAAARMILEAIFELVLLWSNLGMVDWPKEEEQLRCGAFPLFISTWLLPKPHLAY